MPFRTPGGIALIAVLTLLVSAATVLIIIGAAALHVDPRDPAAVWLAGGGGLAVILALIGLWAFLSGKRRRIRQAYLTTLDTSSLPDLAHACILRRRPHPESNVFDAPLWLDRSGPAGPRTILISPETRLPGIAADYSEVISLREEAMRDRSNLAKAVVWSVLALLFLSAGMLSFFPFLSGSPGPIRFHGFIFGALCAGAGINFWARGLATPQLLSPGLLEAGPIIFTRADSILVICDRCFGHLAKGGGDSSAALFIRRDGRFLTIPLGDHLSSPTLPTILARWCRALATASAQ